jgi:hypothetical protein
MTAIALSFLQSIFCFLDNLDNPAFKDLAGLTKQFFWGIDQADLETTITVRMLMVKAGEMC